VRYVEGGIYDDPTNLTWVTPETGYVYVAPVMRVMVSVEDHLTSFQWAAWS
jgi:hypothetical protein